MATERSASASLRPFIAAGLSLVAALALTAPPARAQHHNLPPTANAFHDVLAPVWHSPAGAGRDTRACEQAATLRTRAEAVAQAPVPAAARAEAWRTAATALLRDATAMAAACSATPRGPVAARLTTLHTTFHQLMESLHGAH